MTTETQTLTIPLGRYRHFKGRDYTVLGVARHSETDEHYVVYRKEYGDRGLCIRPYAMFVEEVDKPELNYRGPRFRLIHKNA